MPSGHDTGVAYDTQSKFMLADESVLCILRQ